MISRDFLLGDSNGLEFLDFQNDSFFNELVSVLTKHTDNNILKNTIAGDLKEVIYKYTGFNNIDIDVGSMSNFAIDAGYTSPNNVINNEGLDEFLRHSNTSLYRWFSDSKDKIFKGSIDYKTGKVDGSFSTMPYTMYLDSDLNNFFPPKLVNKYGATSIEATAGAIVHELGHAFGACMMIMTTVEDNILLKAGLRHYREATTDKERLVVLKDTKELLDVKTKDKSIGDLATNPKDDTYLLFYNKMLSQRNQSRSLSLGVPAMTSEVMADMYSIRMGCSKGIIGAVGALVDNGGIKNGGVAAAQMFLLVAITTLMFGWVGGTTYAIIVMMFTLLGFIMGYFGFSYADVYNAGHRRYDDLLRQMISEFKKNTSTPLGPKNELIKKIEEMIKINNDLKPWYDNTFIRRLVGVVAAGADFKAQEVEHFTGVIANSEINVLETKFGNLLA